MSKELAESPLQESDSQTPSWAPKEFKIVVISVLMVCTMVSWIGHFIPWFGGWSGFIIALCFLYLPQEIIERKGATLNQYGISFGNRALGLKNFLLVSLVVFPIYSIGFHQWQTNLVKRKPDFSIRKLADWPLDFDHLNQNNLETKGLRTILRGDMIYLKWQTSNAQPAKIELLSDETIKTISRSKNTHIITTRPTIPPLGHRIEITGGPSGQVRFYTKSKSISLDAHQGTNEETLEILNAFDQPVDDRPMQNHRSFWWLISFILGQLILVALPEEVFYRGYVQPSLEARFKPKHVFLGASISWPALVITSSIFAVGHILTIPNIGRLAVFFPSLLFGWMRNKTGSVFSAVLFHAACNLFAQVAFKFYT